MPPAPLLLLVFNRPSLTDRLFEAIQEHTERPIYIAADGPRADRPADIEACQGVRDLVLNRVAGRDVRLRFQPSNMGLANHIPSAISWAMEHEDRLIILEDDCVPLPGFIPFADELLERYQGHPSVAQISGSNYQNGISRTPCSYYFSGIPAIWGWATWKRAWKLYDRTMPGWDALRNTPWLSSLFHDPTHAHYWRTLFDDAAHPAKGSLESWAIPWTFNLWTHHQLAVTPDSNLITNTAQSAGTNSSGTSHRNMSPATGIEFPLRHPETVSRNEEADAYAMESFYLGSHPVERFFWRLRLPLRLAPLRRILRLARRHLTHPQPGA